MFSEDNETLLVHLFSIIIQNNKVCHITLTSMIHKFKL